MAGLLGSVLRRKRAVAVLGGFATVLAATGVALAGTADAAAGCKVVYSAPSQWPGGFTANVEVTNLGEAVDGWKLTWAFPAGQTINQAWNATVTSAGADVTATNTGWNGRLATGGSTSFGFNGSWTSSNTAPTSFALNGVACTGATTTTSAPPSVTPSVTPSSAKPSVSASVSPSASPSASQPPAGTGPVAAVAAMQPGWNLGNSLDATGADETTWGNPKVTKALIDNVKAQGFRSIRIPVTWFQHQGSGPNYTLDAAYLARVQEVVDWALADDLYVMINLHHDSWNWINAMQSDRTNVVARYNATWTQLAAAFRNRSAKLTFESVNEPQFTGVEDAAAAPLLNELNTSFRTIVRGSGGGNATRLLVLPTLHTSSDQARLDELAATFATMNDPNLIATVHYYGYWPFSVNIAGGFRFDATAQKDVTDMVDRVYNTFVAKGVPVIIGEFGLLGFDRNTGTIEQGEKLKFFEYFGYHTRAKQITTMLWDNGQHFDRTAFTWKDPELWNQIKSSWTTRSGTAYSDQIYVPKTGTITAKTLALNLNGTTFAGLRRGSTDLVKGTDYTVTGDQLTLSAATVAKLAGSRAYGVNATLSARFSAGVPWRIDVITFDPPQLSAGSGNTSSFVIPTAFRGDQLATMEAKYADGSNAGPQNWTPFKEFDATFTPDAKAGTITLKPDFFGEVKDNSTVNLTFHFWSGTVVNYTITRAGSTITGRPAA